MTKQFISEAIRKQHEAMSRAIMLAGTRPEACASSARGAAVEKKVVTLESERNVVKQMLTTTQKERDNLLKEVQRLSSQGKQQFSTVSKGTSNQSCMFLCRIEFDE